MNNYILKTLHFGPLVLERVVKQIPANRLDERPDPERFTIREAVAHLADWEPILRGRMRQLIDRPGSILEPYDEGQMALDNRYFEKDVTESMERLKRERTETIRMLREITPEEWQSAGTHAESGPMTVQGIAAMVQGHDLYHLEQATLYLP